MNGLAKILQNKKYGAFLKIFSLVFVLFIFFGTLNLFQIHIKNYFYFISSPIEKMFWRAGDNASIFLTSFLNARNLEKENQDLKTGNQKLLAEISFLQDAQKQAQAEEAAFLNCSQDNFTLVSASVTGLDADSDIISIDKGSIDGILEGMPVINQQKVLFGKIFKVYKNFSEVMLISQKNNILDVEILQTNLTETSIYGAVKGKGNLRIYLDLVPTDSEIKEGDVLITSALEGTFPKNLLVGTITAKNKNDQKPFQTAQAQPFFDIKNTENLFVITNYKR